MKIKNILLIDDNEIDNYISSLVIKKCKVAEAVVLKSSAEDALEYLSDPNQEFPDIIFLDVRMPIMDGFDFLERYDKFQQERKAKCLVFMLSSSINHEDIERVNNNSHVKKYLSKPLSQNVVVEIVEKYL